MNVSEIMTKAVVTEAADDTLADAAAKMRSQQTGSLLIMEGDRLAGIFTERDLLKAVAQGTNPTETTLKATMTTDIVTIPPTATLRDAAMLMASKWIRHLPVCEGNKVLGVISQRDLAGVLAQYLQEPQAHLVEGELVRSKRIRRIQAGDLD